jgi:hypothetical protein
MMLKSSDDMLALVAELNLRRMGMVLGRRQKRLGGMHLISETQWRWLLIARGLHHRFIGGHYLHTAEEASALNDLMLWLLEEHKQNEGLKEIGQFDFQNGRRLQTTVAPERDYEWHCEKVFGD